MQNLKMPVTTEDAVSMMDTWLRALLPTDGTSRWFGNVECWIDPVGPWAGQISYGIPNSEWDKPSFSRDLTTAIEAERSLF